MEKDLKPIKNYILKSKLNPFLSTKLHLNPAFRMVTQKYYYHLYILLVNTDLQKYLNFFTYIIRLYEFILLIYI